MDARTARKQKTREGLMGAALRLLAEQSFDGLSLREVAREAGVVPTAFYRHFENMDALALALVDDSFRTLREMIRSAREDIGRFEHVIRDSADILVRHIDANPLHFRFIARERSSGNRVLRSAIRNEIRLFASELATDLGRFPALGHWRTEDLQTMAALLVNIAVNVAEGLIEAQPGDERARADLVRTAEKQMTLVALGAAAWDPRREAGPSR